MCLLIVKPAGVTIPRDTLIAAARANPDGAGYAWNNGKQNHIAKSHKWGGDEIHNRLEKLKDYPAIVHFRWATHGSKNNDNTHPFILPGGYVAAHNGIISGTVCKKDESDTRAYLRSNVAPLIRAGSRLDDKDILAMIEKEITTSNKMAFMAMDGTQSIANERIGSWVDGAWLSNRNHEFSTHTYYSGNWGKRSAYADNYDDKPEKIEGFMHARDMHCGYCGWKIKGYFLIEQDEPVCAACCGYSNVTGLKLTTNWRPWHATEEGRELVKARGLQSEDYTPTKSGAILIPMSAAQAEQALADEEAADELERLDLIEKELEQDAEEEARVAGYAG